MHLASLHTGLAARFEMHSANTGLSTYTHAHTGTICNHRTTAVFPQRNVTNHELSPPGRGGESPSSTGEFDVYLKTHASHHITSQPGLIECACLRVARPRASIPPQSMPLIVRSTQESSYAQPVCNASLTFDYFGSLQRSTVRHTAGNMNAIFYLNRVNSYFCLNRIC